MSLSFAGTVGGSNPTAKTITVTTTGTGTLTWAVTDNANWLTATQSGNSIVAVASLAGLASGTYNGTITVTATGTTNTPQNIPVSFTVSAAPTPTPTPIMSVGPSSFSFTAQAGSTAPQTQALTISNTGGGTLNWTVSDDSAWVTKNLDSGTGNVSLVITVNPSGLSAGTHTSMITVSAASATNSPRVIPVTLTLTAPPAQPTITMSPTNLAFIGTVGGSNPAPKAVTVTNSGTGTLTWSVTDNANWLTATQSGNSVMASVNMAGLAAGTYSGIITVTATGATNTPQTLPVSLTVSSQTTNRSATLMWNANTEPDLAGYKVYMAAASGGYGAPVAVLQGNVTSYIAPSLQVGTTYFFVITSYDSSDNESAWSSEVSKSIF